ELDRKAGFLLQRLEAAHAFEVNPHVGERLTSFPNRPAHILTCPAPQRVHRSGWELDFKESHRAIGEEVIAGAGLLVALGCRVILGRLSTRCIPREQAANN